MKNILLYAHGGSKNHGCEAIVRSSCKIFDESLKVIKIDLLSSNYKEDLYYNINQLCDVYQMNNLIRYSPRHFYYRIKRILTKNLYHYAKYQYSKIFKTKNDLYFSIGGDNYCYKGFPSIMGYINHRLNQSGKKTVLWGCSVEPKLLESKEILEDMQRYALITARESLTYDALINAGIIKNTHLIPDPAFLLDTVKLDLPNGFAENNTIGINVSPLIIDSESKKGATMQNYTALIKYIIDTTDMQIALIPHVIWDTNDDRKPLGELYNKFKDTGRIVMVDDHNCMELKGYISHCRMFIGARTHATIAAYSTCVPTLVVGYSVKAKGIAKDIFGSYENYVIPVQTLEKENDLINAFEWLKNNENSIRNHLAEFMPGYIEKAWQAGEEVKELLEEF